MSYVGVRPEHLAVRESCGDLRRLPHGRDRDLRPAGRSAAPAPALERRLAAGGGRRPVLPPLPAGRRHPRRPVHLPPRRRPLSDGHERRQSRARLRVVRGARRRLRRRGSATRSTTTRCSPSRGPQARADRRAGSPTAELPSADAHRAARRSPGSEALVCGTGYTGEDGVELLLDPTGAASAWDALVGAGATPAGLGARDTLRLEVCFHLYGNDMDEHRNPIEAGLGWCCQGGDRLHRLRGGRRGPRGRHGADSSPRSCSLAAGIPRPGQRGVSPAAGPWAR